MRISDWSSDVCSSDLRVQRRLEVHGRSGTRQPRSTDCGSPFDPDQKLCHTRPGSHHHGDITDLLWPAPPAQCAPGNFQDRSEEHTSELQSLMRISYAVFCLKKTTYTNIHRTHI